MKKIIIVGAGLGGLAAGVLLQVRGFDVTIVEKNGHVGGKMMPMNLGEYSFDFGPNTITMPHVFQQVFKEAGENPDDYMRLIKLNNHTKNWFNDGSTFMMTTNRDEMIHQLEQLDPNGAKNYEHYLASVKKLYTIAQDQFFYRTFSSWKDYMNPSLFTSLLKVKPFETIDSFHRRFFENEKVINAFNRYATYIGSSPYVSPATFSLIGHLEMNEGVYYVQGGNSRIAEGFAKVFQKAGGTLVLNEQVEKVQVKNKKAVGIKLESGEKLPADSIIVNGDLLQAYPFLVDEADRPHFTNKMVSKFEPSISAYVILAGTKNRNDSLIHHQVYFAEDYKREFYELFEKKQLPADPTIYICNSSYTDRSVAPGDNLFILVNAPAGMSNDNGYEQVIYEKLKRFDIDITSTLSCQKIITPSWIEKQFGAYKGALYGISANRKMDSFLRPSNVSKDVRGLYFVGGTTHPGGGSPMVTISGINVANLIST